MAFNKKILKKVIFQKYYKNNILKKNYIFNKIDIEVGSHNKKKSKIAIKK